MAQITKSIAETYQLAAWLVPAEIAKAISQDELVDRLAEAKRLGERAADPSVPGDLRTAYKMRAQAVLKARPRDAVAREHAALIAKAAQLPNAQADAVREHARRLIEEDQPPAPRLGVRKAKGDDQVPVFDQAGNLVGVCDPDDITPLGSAGGKAPRPAVGADVPPPDPGAGDAVAKAVSRCPVVVYDQFRKPFAVDRRNIRESAVRKEAAGAGQITFRDRADGMTDVIDAAGRPIGTINSQGMLVRQGYAGEQQSLNPTAQARNTGPVRMGGTTGLGAPRRAGPAAALPADGPQQAAPGDLDRTVIKALNPGWTAVHDWTGALVGAVKTSNVLAAPRPGTVAKGQLSHSHANVYDASKRRVGMARLSHVIPVAELRKALGTERPRRQAGR